MTKADELNALADRVEREDESRKLDDAIWETIEGRPSYILGHPFKNGNPPRRTRLPIPAYTTSLDAAVTLVPEGWHVDVHDWRWSEEPCWAVAIQRVSGTYTSISVKAKTEAMARVSAALRARAALS